MAIANEQSTEPTKTGSEVEQVDAIADLLVGDDENEEGTETEQESNDAGDGESEGSNEGEGEEDEQEAGEEDATWSSVLGVDDSQVVVDEKGNLQGVQVKIDGEVSTVSVKDLIAGYQTNKYNTQKSQALSQEKKEFEQVRAEVSKAYLDRLATAEKLTELLDQSLMGEYNKIDWQTLRVQNPAEYAAAIQDFQARKGQIEAIKTAISQEAQTTNQEHQQEIMQRQSAFMSDQYQRVLANNPDWKDQNKMVSELREMGEVVATAYGITPEEFAAVSDARYVEILKDAVAYRKGKQLGKQKLKTVPKFVKQQGAKPKKPMDKFTRLKLNARKATGHNQRELQADAIAELLMNG